MLLLVVVGGLFSGATAAPVAAAAPLVRADPTPAANCSVLPSATDQDLVAALGWVCGAGKVECSAINPGGSHYMPNDAKHHADYAFTEFYHAHDADGYDTCFFGGNAAVDPPPAGHWLFVKGALMYPYPRAKEGMGLWDTIRSGQTAVYSTGTFGGTYHDVSGKGFTSTIFNIWVASSSSPTDMHVEISYHLPCLGHAGNAKYRSEWYNQMTAQPAPNYQSYTNAIGAMQTRGDFCDVDPKGAELAYMNLTVTVLPGGSDIQIMFATASLPSFVTAPYV